MNSTTSNFYRFSLLVLRLPQSPFACELVCVFLCRHDPKRKTFLIKSREQSIVKMGGALSNENIITLVGHKERKVSSTLARRFSLLARTKRKENVSFSLFRAREHQSFSLRVCKVTSTWKFLLIHWRRIFTVDGAKFNRKGGKLKFELGEKFVSTKVALQIMTESFG
jgi:hypothetical protein